MFYASLIWFLVPCAALALLFAIVAGANAARRMIDRHAANTLMRPRESRTLKSRF